MTLSILKRIKDDIAYSDAEVKRMTPIVQAMTPDTMDAHVIKQTTYFLERKQKMENVLAVLGMVK